MNTLLDRFVAAFGVWEEALPYLHMMVDEPEMRLVVAMRGQSVTVDEAAKLLGIEHAGAADLLQRSYARCILNKIVEAGTTTYAPADFGQRLDHFAKFENWDDIPAEDRRALNAYLAATRRAAGFRVYERLFAWWHAFHMPLCVMLFVAAAFHVLAVHRY